MITESGTECDPEMPSDISTDHVYNFPSILLLEENK